MERRRPLEVVTTAKPYIWPTLLPRDAQGSASPVTTKWRLGSRVVVPAVGLFSKFWMTVVNTSKVHNSDVLYRALQDNYETCSHDLQHSSSFSTNRSALATVSAADGSQAKSRARPLITYSNHSSCMDDPLIWGALLPFRWQFNADRHRWSAAAAELCFDRNWHAIFFSLGKTFPILRGEGIYQPAMNYAASLMRSGVWMHFFPEGKVIPRLEKADPKLLKFKYDADGKPLIHENNHDQNNMASMVMKKRLARGEPSLCDRLVSLMESQPYSLKWGVARLIIEHVLGEGQMQDEHYEHIRPSSSSGPCGESASTMQVLPEVDVLPIYHVGMDDVLPTRQPYIPRIFKRVTFFVRPEGPIRIDRDFLLRLFNDDDGEGELGPSRESIPQRLELTLTEKRIRLMRYLEDELNRLSSRAHWLHEKWQSS